MRISVLYVIVLLLFVDNIAEISCTMEDQDHDDNVIDNDNVIFPNKNNTIKDHEDDSHHDHDHHDHDDHPNGAGSATHSILFLATTVIISVYGFRI